MTDFAQRMFDANVRVEKMFWISGVCAAPPSDFEEFIENDLAEAPEVLKVLPWLSETDGDAEEVLVEFANRGIDGFVVQLARPIPRDFMTDGRGYSFSWGYYQTSWFFFETLEALCDRAATWASEVVEAARRKSATHAS